MQGRRRPYRKQAEKLGKNRQFSLDSRIQSICDTIEGYLPDLDEMNSEYNEGSPEGQLDLDDNSTGDTGTAGIAGIPNGGNSNAPLRTRSKSVCTALHEPTDEDNQDAYQQFARHIMLRYRSPSLQGLKAKAEAEANRHAEEAEEGEGEQDTSTGSHAPIICFTEERGNGSS